MQICKCYHSIFWSWNWRIDVPKYESNPVESGFHHQNPENYPITKKKGKYENTKTIGDGQPNSRSTVHFKVQSTSTLFSFLQGCQFPTSNTQYEVWCSMEVSQLLYSSPLITFWEHLIDLFATVATSRATTCKNDRHFFSIRYPLAVHFMFSHSEWI